VSAAWISELLGGATPAEGETVSRNGRSLSGRGGVARDLAVAEGDQAQTRDTFAFKWGKRDTYSSDSVKAAHRAWLASRFGGRDLLAHLGDTGGRRPLVLDAGCGSGFSANLMLGPHFDSIRYVGSDISTAVDIAAETLRPMAPERFFLQADLMHLPFLPSSFDIVVAEGVLHHTPSARAAVLALAPLVRQGGIFAFYVYAKKAPVREFTDDYIRAKVAELPPQEAWKALEPLTRLGIALGELKTEIVVPEDVPLLGIPKGRIDIRRLFYWTICKAYYRPDFSFEDMNHISFDWFTPKYCHRQTPDEVRDWCAAAGLVIEHMKVEEAGITTVARRPPG
jgi:arsenite methyltransferase